MGLRAKERIGNGLIASGIVAALAAASALATPSRTLDVEQAASRFKNTYMRPKSIPSPKENPTTPAKVTLGRTLFFDPRLSASGWISCATCHNPGFAWGDGLPKGIGHGMKTLGRKTPTLINVAWSEPLMWDGRSPTLEEQALGPIQSSDEMAMEVSTLEGQLKSIPGYVHLFRAAFPGEPIRKELVGMALAAYQRTIVSANAPFDLWLQGNKNALSEEAKRGFLLFNGKANCVACHSGWRFTDDSFHDIGVADADKGRGALPDYGDIESMQHAFKTPTLRNVSLRAPYLHDGSEKTLADVIEFYQVGGRAKRPSLSNEIKPLKLSNDEKRHLLQFLLSLTSPDPAPQVPLFPR